MEEKNENKNIIEIKYTYQEFKNIDKYFPYKSRKTFLITAFFISLLFLFIIIDPEDLSLDEILLAYGFLIISSYVLIKLIYFITRKIRYKIFFKNNKDKLDYTIEIEKESIIKKSKKETKTIFYSDIKKYKYRKDHFYLIINKNEIIPIKVDEIPKEELAFLEIAIKKHDYKEENINIKDYLKEKDKRNPKVKLLLSILFILSVLSPFIAEYLIQFIVKLKYINIAELILEYSPLALLLLPLPIMSVLISKKYQNEGYKCTINIVVGVISCITLVLISLSYFDYKENLIRYENLSVYEYAIKEDVPTKGKLLEIRWDESDFQNHKTLHAKFTNQEESNNFYQRLKNNKNWIKREDVSIAFAQVVNNYLKCTKNTECLYLFYTDGDHLVNKMPDHSGTFYAHFMMYNPKSKVLTIENFEYNHLNPSSDYFNQIDESTKDNKNTSEL